MGQVSGRGNEGLRGVGVGGVQTIELFVIAFLQYKKLLKLSILVHVSDLYLSKYSVQKSAFVTQYSITTLNVDPRTVT